MFCWKCGKEAEDYQTFCSYCGTKLVKEDMQENKPIKQPMVNTSSVNLRKYVLPAALSAVAIGGLVLVGFGGVKLVKSVTSIVSTGSKNVNGKKAKPFKETPEIKEEYIKRLQAYDEYFKRESENLSDSVYGVISLDEEHLPILWLYYDNTPKSDWVYDIPDEIQGDVKLIGYENGMATILASQNYIRSCQGISPGICKEGVFFINYNTDICAPEKPAEVFYIYNKEAKSFIEVAMDNPDVNKLKFAQNYSDLYSKRYYVQRDGNKEIMTCYGIEDKGIAGILTGMYELIDIESPDNEYYKLTSSTDWATGYTINSAVADYFMQISEEVDIYNTNLTGELTMMPTPDCEPTENVEEIFRKYPSTYYMEGKEVTREEWETKIDRDVGVITNTVKPGGYDDVSYFIKTLENVPVYDADELFLQETAASYHYRLLTVDEFEKATASEQ